MAEHRITDETVREYLLGRIVDETMLENIEEKLFADDDFCAEVALVEDGLINDYVLGRLSAADTETFHSTLANDSERRMRVELSEALRQRARIRDAEISVGKTSFLGSLRALIRQPQYAGALILLLIGAVILGIYLTRKTGPDDLAELRAIYRQGRPTETRISEFDYAPLNQLRGAPEAAEQTRLRRIENDLIERAERSPNAQNLHALGVFDVTQRKYAEAIKQFESAVKLAPKDARIHNDLGVAHFELAKTKPADKRLEDLAQSLEEFTTATQLQSDSLEALFNKAMAQQALGMNREAKGAWQLYLQKDSSSAWAEEARKNLSLLAAGQTQFKNDADVVADFLNAFRNQDEMRAKRIHDETKGLMRGPMIPLQLTRRYLAARQANREAEATETLNALIFIGNLEQQQHDEKFFIDLANFYRTAGAATIQRLSDARGRLDAAQQLASEDPAKAVSEFEASRDLFGRMGNASEALVAESGAIEYLPDLGRVGESRERLAALIDTAEKKSYRILLPSAHYWLGISDSLQNEYSESNKQLRTALRLAEASENVFEVQHAQDALAVNYFLLGELSAAATYAGRMLGVHSTYFQSSNQWVREQGTLADVTLRLNFFSTSLGFSREVMSAAQEIVIRPRQVNDSLRRMIRSSAAKRDFDSALNYLDESMRVARARADGPDKTRTTAELYGLLADLQRDMQNYQGALNDYDQALALYASLPEITFGLYQIHKGKLFCFRLLNQHDQFAAELKTVLDLSEKYRQTIREDESRQDFFAQQQDVFDAAIEESLRAGDSRGAFRFAEASRARSLLEFVGSGKSISESENEFGPVTQPLPLEEIQRRLPEQIQLVEYVVLPDKLAIWILSRARFDFREKPINATELTDEIQAYEAAIINRASAADLKPAARKLYESLIPADLEPDKQLCLLPDKSLHQLSFATLLSREGKYLLENYSLIYAPSASVTILASENATGKQQTRAERVLAIGNPDFDREENPDLPDLQSAEVEAKTIAAGYRDSLELLGAKATKENFLRDISGADVIHFAGHFVTNRQSPANSKLLFAGGDLRSSELGAYRLPKVKLVVMSACETGFERYSQGEGAIGVARIWLAMGAPLVVATQWKVDSNATRDLMISFHRARCARAMSSADSLRAAQLEVMKSETTSAPFYWGAFAAFGGYTSY
jgi:CHAT domain-containing protein/TolA-binding protein